ncbi:hypothetical protein ACO0OL_001220 [Hanseniaspora opuntiae]
MQVYNTSEQNSFENAINAKKAEKYKELIEHFTDTVDENDFLDKLDSYCKQPWERNQDLMLVWMPVLNKIQDNLKNIIDENNLNIHIPDLNNALPSSKSTQSSQQTETKPNYDGFLTHLSKEIELKLIKYLDFTFFILQNTTNRHNFLMINQILALLNAPNIEVKLRCVKLLLIDIGESVGSWNPDKNMKQELRSKLTSMILALQCHISCDNNLKNSFDLVDFLANCSPKSYGIPESASIISPANTILPFTFKYYSEKNNNNLEVFKITNEKLLNTSYEELLNLIKSQKKIPEHYWFEISMQLYVAKSFAVPEDNKAIKVQNTFLLENDKDKLQNIFDTLNPYIQLKFYSVGLINVLLSPPAVSSTIFELDGSIFECLCRFILQGYPLQKVPSNFPMSEIRVSALYALKFISDRHVWCLDILKCIGGNATHGPVFLLFDRIKKAIALNSDDIDVAYNMKFFDVISNLTGVSSICDSLVSAGLIHKLVDILNVYDYHEYQTMLKVSSVLKNCLKKIEDVNTFENAGGYTLLHDRLSTEIEYGLATKDQFKHIKHYTEVYFTLSFRQVSFIRSFLKTILKVIDIDTTDKIRNFMDSKLLGTLNTILLNRNDFGFTLLSYVLDIVQVLLNKDPTIYQILQEAGTVDIIINNFAEYLGPWDNLLLTLPQLVSALCLNKSALEKIKESNIIKLLFQPYRDAKLAAVLIKYMESEYAEHLDELYRYHPDLQEMMTNEFADAINSLEVNFEEEPLMQPPNSSLFTNSGQSFEGIARSSDFSFDSSDSGILIRCAFLSLYGCEWANLSEKLDCDTIIKKIYNERTPGTFLKSDTQVAVIDVLKSSELFDFETISSSFTTTVFGLLKKLESFKVGYENESFFLNCNDEQEIMRFSGLLNSLSVNFQTLVNTGFEYGTFSDRKCQNFAKNYMNEINSENNIFTSMSNLVVKLIVEENQIARSLSPQQDIDTLVQRPYHITIKNSLDVKKEKSNHYFTNNVFMIRYWVTNINYNMMMFFKSFLRIFSMERTRSTDDSTTEQLMIMECCMKALLNILNFFNKENLEIDETIHAIFLVYSCMKKQPFGYQGISAEIDYFVCNLYYKYKLNFKLFEILDKIIQKHLETASQKDFKFYDVKSKLVFPRQLEVLVPKCIQLLFEMTTWANKCFLSVNQEKLYSVIFAVINVSPEEDAKTFTNYMLQSDIECINTINQKYFKGGILKHAIFTDKTFVKIVDCYLDIMHRGLDINAFDKLKDYRILYADSNNTSLSLGLKKIIKQRVGDVPNISSYVEEAEDIMFQEPQDQSGFVIDHASQLNYADTELIEKDDIDIWFDTYCNYAVTEYDKLYFDGEESTMHNWIKKMTTANIVCSFDSFDGYSFNAKKIIELIIGYPRCIRSIYSLLRMLVASYDSIYSHMMENASEHNKSNNFVGVFGHICIQFVLYLSQNSQELSPDNQIPILEFIGLLLSKPLKSDIDRYQLSIIAETFASTFTEKVNNHGMSKKLLPGFLFVFETLYSHFRYTSLSNLQHIELPEEYHPEWFGNFNQKFVLAVMDIVLKCKSIKSVELGCSVARVCILNVLEDYENVPKIINSKILVELLKCIGINQKDKFIVTLQNSFIILCRLCLEDPEIVGSIISKEALDSEDTVHVLKQRKSYLAFRDNTSLLRALYEQGFNFKIGKFDDEPVLLRDEVHKLFRYRKSMKPTNIPAKTDIVYLIFSQLIATYKTDWISEDEATNYSSFDVDNSKNISFNYMKFLLNTLTELILSYQQSKLDLISYSKRNIVGQSQEPRTTSVNFLIHEFLPFAKYTSVVKRDSVEEKKHYLYRKAKLLLQNLLTNKKIVNFPTIENLPLDKTDHASIFIRKHVLQCLVKVIHPDNMNIRNHSLTYTDKEKIYGCILFLNDLFLSFSSLKTELVTILKLIIQLNIPNMISLIVNRLDNSLSSNVSELNMQIFVCLRSFHNILEEYKSEFINCKPLHNLINEQSDSSHVVRGSHSSKHVDDQGSSSDDSDDDEKDDTNKDPTDHEKTEENMFRHSALAMYDIEDIEEEVMNDQNSIFDEDYEDEDLAFVDDAALQNSLDLVDDTGAENINYDGYSGDDEDADSNSDDDIDIIHGDVVLDDLSSQSESRSIFDSDDEEGVIYLDNDIVLLDEDDEDNENFVEDPLGYEVNADEFNAHINERELYESDFVSGLNASSSDDASYLRDDSDFTDYSDFAHSEDESIDLSGSEGSESGYSSSEEAVAQYIIDDHNSNLVDTSMRTRQHRGSFMVDVDNINISPHNADSDASVLNMFATRFPWSELGNTILRNNRRLSHSGAFGLFSSEAGFSSSRYNTNISFFNATDNILGSNEAHQRFNNDEVEIDEATNNNKPLFLSKANLDLLFEDDSVSTLKRWEEIQRMFPVIEFYSTDLTYQLCDGFSRLDFPLIVESLYPILKLAKLPGNQQLPQIGTKRKAELSLDSDISSFENSHVVDIDGAKVDVSAFGLNVESFSQTSSAEKKKHLLFEHIVGCLINQGNYYHTSCPPDLMKLNDKKNTPEIHFGDVLALPNPFVEEIETLQSTRENQLSLKMKDLLEKGRYTDNTEKKKQRRPVLYDRAAIYSLSKSFFIYQPYLKREPFHEFFTILCKHSKKVRNEFLNLLLLIISEGLHSSTALSDVYGYISNKIDKLINPNTFTIRPYVLSNDCTVDNVGSQSIDCLQHLSKEYAPCFKFFTTTHQDLLVTKHRKFFGDNFSKNSLKINGESGFDLSYDDFTMNDSESHNSKACPINYLFTALCIPVVRNEVTLMDALSLTVKTIIHSNCVTKKSENKHDQLGTLLMDSTFRILLSVVSFESSTTRTLENIINSLQVLKETYYNTDEHSTNIIKMISKFCKNCASICSKKLDEMINLIDSGEKEIITSEDPNDIVTTMSAANSSQSCLLKYITIIDFLFFQKKADSKSSIGNENLLKAYVEIPFSELWFRFSTYLNKFEAINGNTSNVTKILFLLPLLESVMIDCKINLLFSENKINFSKIGKQFIFEHKTLLNSMIRTSPKLMNGPFSILLTLDSSAVDFDNKRFFFKTKLKQMKRFDNSSVDFTVNRSSIFSDSFHALYSDLNSKFKTGKLNVTFVGEEGVDAGGLTREWYQLISRQMVSSEFSLFTPVSDENNDTFIPNSNVPIDTKHLSYYEFCGMIMAKAIHDSCFLDCHFIRPIYKAIIGKNPGLKDMESIDPEYYKSLIWILENDITDVLDITFSLETENSGKYESHDLIPNGSEIAVTEENKKEYVNKVIDFKLKLSFKIPLEHLVTGFYSIIDKELIEIFNENELELLLNGLPDIDVDDWKNNTEYVNYTSQSPEISLFWRCVRSFNQVEKAKLLQFITGTSKVPLNGFRDLQGSNGSSKFSIHKDFGSSSRLPQAHTCFNQLDLPSYKTYEEMKRAFLVAINEGSEGFGLK